MRIFKCYAVTIGALFSYLVGLADAPPATYPSWWYDGVIPGTSIVSASGTHVAADNYAPANLGQLKWVTLCAKTYLDTLLVAQGGSQIDPVTLFPAMPPEGDPAYPAALATNYAPANLGQLKAVSKLFYDRLNAVGYGTNAYLISQGYPASWTSPYPWPADGDMNANYAPVNIGQLKLVFGFILSVPNAVSVLRSGNSATINWSASPGIVYTVERRTSDGSYVTLGQVTGTGSYVDPTLSTGSLYYYRVNAANAGGLTLNSPEVSSATPSPGLTVMAGQRLWLSAGNLRTDASGGIILLSDSSGRGNDATAGGSLTVASGSGGRNGNPIIVCGGLPQAINIPDIMSDATQGEVFIVMKTNDATGYLWTFGQYGSNYQQCTSLTPLYFRESFGLINTSRKTAVPLVSPGLWQIYGVSVKPGEYKIRQNGVAFYDSNVTASEIGFPAVNNLAIAQMAGWLNGDIAELIIYDHVLSDTDRELVNRYLNTKYALVSTDHFRDYLDDSGSGYPNWVIRALGYDPSSLDFDGDGISNAAEIRQGTDMFRADTYTPPSGSPSDHTAPVINLDTPAYAVPVN